MIEIKDHQPSGVCSTTSPTAYLPQAYTQRKKKKSSGNLTICYGKSAFKQVNNRFQLGDLFHSRTLNYRRVLYLDGSIVQDFPSLSINIIYYCHYHFQYYI